MRTNDLVRFIRERENVRKRKEAGERPYTRDPILAKYKFCNVRREDDRVTRWLRENWYPSFDENPDLWFAAVVARLFNLPASLEAISEVTLPFKPEAMRKILHRRKDAGQKNFNAAYIVSTNGVAMDKVDYIVTRVLGPVWAARAVVRPAWLGAHVIRLETFHEGLTKFDGLGSFIAAQVIADLKYVPPLQNAPDWWTFAASGPGSRRGLNIVMGFPVNLHLPEAGWRAHLSDIRERVNAKLLHHNEWTEALHAQDLQNCLCEFSKYSKAQLGLGTPKQLYKPYEETS